LRAIGSFPVDRGRPDRVAVRTAIDRLEKGHVVGLFPEGGIRDGANSVLGGASLRSGIGAIAHLGRAPVVPCVILGSDRLYAWRSWLPFRRAKVWVVFGDPLSCGAGGKSARNLLQAELADSLRALLGESQRRFGLTADDLPHPPSLRRGNLRRGNVPL
jgi:1-acyl-sn-glycerol-3-phosphate acyltransferase